MNRNYIRYSHGGIMLDLENQKSHYRFLAHPRKSMKIVEDALTNSRSITTKYEKDQQDKKQKQNMRLFRALHTIKNGKGIVEQMSDRAKMDEKYMRILSLAKEHKHEEQRKEMRKRNTLIVSKIGYAKPRVGCSVDWSQHFEQAEKHKSKLSKADKHFFDAETIILEAEAPFRNTLRDTISSQFRQTSKSSRKNKTACKHKKSNGKNKGKLGIDQILNEEAQGELTQSQKNDEHVSSLLPQIVVGLTSRVPQ